jgi:hypothetical protein
MVTGALKRLAMAMSRAHACGVTFVDSARDQCPNEAGLARGWWADVAHPARGDGRPAMIIGRVWRLLPDAVGGRRLC